MLLPPFLQERGICHRPKIPAESTDDDDGVYERYDRGSRGAGMAAAEAAATIVNAVSSFKCWIMPCSTTPHPAYVHTFYSAGHYQGTSVTPTARSSLILSESFRRTNINTCVALTFYILNGTPRVFLLAYMLLLNEYLCEN